MDDKLCIFGEQACDLVKTFTCESVIEGLEDLVEFTAGI